MRGLGFKHIGFGVSGVGLGVYTQNPDQTNKSARNSPIQDLRGMTAPRNNSSQAGMPRLLTNMAYAFFKAFRLEGAVGIRQFKDVSTWTWLRSVSNPEGPFVVLLWN